MATKKKYNEDDLKTIFYELQTELLKFKSSLSKLETDLGILQAGDKSGPYWNGDNACEVYKACLVYPSKTSWTQMADRYLSTRSKVGIICSSGISLSLSNKDFKFFIKFLR